MARRAQRSRGDSALADALAELRAAPPKSFTSTRDALVRRLKDAGDAEAAAAVKQQKKPSASVWAVAALAREAPEVVSALLEAGSKVRLAQRKALSGVGAAELRDASRRVHDEVYRAAGRASELLESAGESTAPAVLERVRQTLLAIASGDDELRGEFREGTVEGDLSPAGFGLVTPLRVVPAAKEKPPAKARAARVPSAAKQDWETAKREREAAKREAAEAKRREEEERRRQDEARKHRAQLEKAVHLAEAEAKRLQKFAESAEARARAARAQADEAASRAEEARAALDSASS